MTAATLITPVAVPLLIALLLVLPRLRDHVMTWAAWAPLPALALAVAGPEASVRVPWLLLDSHFALDELGRMFLFGSATVWLLSGIYARGYLATDPRRPGFYAFFLLAMGGNLGLILAADLASFYFFFALMSYSAYGLVIHERGAHAIHAGRVYILMAVLGDAILLAGLVLIASGMTWLPMGEVPESLGVVDLSGAAVPLVIAGLGVKVAVLPLHVWLPLAHPVAPTPASAALSGAMIKAGLLGWLRLLPLGTEALSGWGAWAMAGGMGAVFYGVVAGLPQRDPKTVLAYSSVSQMGLMTAATGVALAVPAHAPVAVAAAALHAVHHGLAKTSLFLSVGVVQARVPRRWRAAVVAGVALPALALAAAPLTGGAISKKALGGAFAHAPGGWSTLLGTLLPITSVATLLLMLRFAQILHRRADAGAVPPAPSMGTAWGASVLATASALWLIPWGGAPGHAGRATDGGAMVSSLWPLLLGWGVAFLAIRVRRHWRMPVPTIPPGDLVVFAERGILAARRFARAAAGVHRPTPMGPPWTLIHSLARTGSRLLAPDEPVRGWTVGAMWVVIGVALLFALLVWQ
jgi:formate hydrogenlyase subunit 3/multisubunit Na+/H+ antiporter MnhD subunit